MNFAWEEDGSIMYIGKRLNDSPLRRRRLRTFMNARARARDVRKIKIFNRACAAHDFTQTSLVCLLPFFVDQTLIRITFQCGALSVSKLPSQFMIILFR